MTPAEDNAFTQFLFEKASEAEALGYRPTLFKQMLGSQGGEATVRQLLAKGKPSEGFTRLWELRRLDLTVEALIVETRWRNAFEPALLQQAENLLRRSQYRFMPFPEADAADGDRVAVTSSAGTSAIEALLPRPRNALSFSAFCAYVGAPLANRANRWCGYNPQRGYAVFTLWADRLVGSEYLLWDSALRTGDTRIGATELKQVVQNVMSRGHSAYGIRCEAQDVHANPRKRGIFDEDQLLVLQLEQRGRDVVATVIGATPAVYIAEGRHGPVVPFDSAIDDLGAPPVGQSTPERTEAAVGGGFRRDAAVRSFVIRRSRGRCEYCGALGFAMGSGSHYVEAHHIIALAAAGPDTVDNVIALCPSHHREAHYGEQSEVLEQAFLAKLQELPRT